MQPGGEAMGQLVWRLGGQNATDLQHNFGIPGTYLVETTLFHWGQSAVHVEVPGTSTYVKYSYLYF